MVKETEWKSSQSRLAAGRSEVPCAEAGVRLGCGIAGGAEGVEIRKRAGGGSGRQDYRPRRGSGFGRDFSRPPPAMCFEVKDCGLFPCISFDDNGEQG